MQEIKVEYLPIEQVIPYANNARKHGEEDTDAIMASIREFGFTNPILVWKNIICAGHGRLIAAKRLGMEKVPVIHLDYLTDEQRKAYILADNKTAELSGWDFDILAAELEDITDIDMSQFGFEFPEEDEPIAVTDDDYNEEHAAQRCNTGDLWELGGHRLICGDSTDPAIIEKLMGGVKADLLLTDPPYNVALGMGGSVDEARKRHRRTDGLVIMNDKMEDEDFYSFLLNFYIAAFANMKEGASFYIWHADNESLNFRKALKDAGVTLRQTLIWNKNTMTLGRQDYQWKHEPCLYGWKDGASHHWYSDRSQTTVLDFDKPSRSELHPTMKPLDLISYQINCSTKKGDAVLDCFGGSGTTLIACEQLKRTCYMCELDTHYCDVIIDRWEQFTGDKAVLLNNV